MIHAIVYAKQNGVLDFYQATPQFPRELLPQIRQVCDRVGAGHESDRLEYALRYAPLRDYGMLQVMIRNQGNEIDERRVHWNVVTYLLEEMDAFRFFQVPFRTAQYNALALSSALLRSPRGFPLPRDLGLRLLAQTGGADPEDKGGIPVQVLLQGAFYGKGALKNDRLFIQSTDPALELERMLQVLPPYLRRDISFHTGISSPEDTRGVSICCCTPPMLERLVASGFNGCEAGNIFFHYAGESGQKNRPDTRWEKEMRTLVQQWEHVVRFDILQYAVRDWRSYLELGRIRSGKSALREVLSILKDEDLERALEIARERELEPLTQWELKQFLAAARGKPESKRKLKLLRGSVIRPEHLEAAICAAAMLTVLALTGSLWGQPGFWKSVIMWILAFGAGFKLRGIFPTRKKRDHAGRA